MILRNFINIATGGLGGISPRATTNKAYNKNYFIPNTPPSSQSFDMYNNTGVDGGSGGTLASQGIVLSSDTTPPSLSDYRVTNYYTKTELTDISHTSAANNGIYTCTQTVRNDGTNNVIINTVGIFMSRVPNTTSVARYLITKTLLDTPVTVAPGETKTITITVNLKSFVENVNA